MTHWVHWDEQPKEPDDQRIPYYAGPTFIYSSVKDGDSFSDIAERYFGFSVEPSIDLSSVMVSFVGREDVEFKDKTRNVCLNDRDVIRLMEVTGVDPPDDFEIDGVFTREWVNNNRALFASVMTKGLTGAATVTWDNGDASGLWSSDTAWVGDTKPAVGDSVVFDGTSTDNCNMDAVAGTFVAWTITTSYTGTITLNAASAWSGTIAIDFGGAGTFAGTSTITLTGTQNLSCDQTIPSLEINSAGTVTQLTTITTGATELTSGTFAIAATIHNTTGALSVHGTMTITTGTIHVDGATDIAGTLGGNSAYTLNMDGNLSASAGTLSAPNASGAFTFSGATWVTPTTFTANSGRVTFDLAGTTTLGNASTQFYLIRSASGNTFDTSAASNYALTVTGGLEVYNGTVNTNASTCSLTGTAGGSACSVYLNSTGTSTMNCGSGTHTWGSFIGENDTNLTLSTGTTTVNNTYASAAMAFGLMTFDDGNGTLAFTYAGTQLLQSTSNTARTFYNVTVNNASCDLHYRQTLGFAMTVANNLTITAGSFSCWDDTSLTGRALTVAATLSVTGTLNLGASVTNTLATVTINDAGTIADGTSISNISGNVTVGGGASGAFTVNTGTIHIDGTTTINASATLGTAAKAYTLNMDGNLLASTGTLIAPNVSGTFTYSGATWLSPTTFTHSSGTVTFDLSGTTTLGNDSIQFNAVAIGTTAPSVTTTFDTSGSNYNLTTANIFSINKGTVNLNGSTVICASGSTTLYGITLGGSCTLSMMTATVTCNALQANNDSNVLTLTSGTLTINGIHSSGTSFNTRSTTTFDDGNGTLVFTYAGAQQLYDNANTARTFYNLTVNNASCALSYYAGAAYNTTVANNLTITAGSYTVWDGTTGKTLTVAATTSVTGTLTPKGTATLATLTINDGGTYANGTQTSNVSGNVTVGGGASGAITTGAGTIHIDGTTTINAGATLGSAATGYTLNMDGNLLASAGTLIAPNNTGSFTYSGVTWLTPTTYTHSTGTAAFDLAGTTTLGNNSTSFNRVSVLAGTTLDTSAASNYNLTGAGQLYVGGTFNANNSTLSCASGSTGGYGVYMDAATGDFNGGTGAHTFGSIYKTTACAMQLTSGTTTLNGYSSGVTVYMNNVTNFDANGGTVTFTYTGDTSGLSLTASGITFYNLTVSTTGRGVVLAQGSPGPVNVGGNLAITAGYLQMYDVFNTAKALTVTGTTVLSTGAGLYGKDGGTLTFNGTVTVTGTANLGLTATKYQMDMNANLLTSTGVLQAPNATGTFTYSGATWLSPTTYTHNSGTLTFDLAGTTTLGNASIQFNAVTVSNGTTLAASTYNLTLAGNLVVGGGASGALTTGVASHDLNGTTTINAGATLGSAATAYTIDFGGDVLASAGTLIAPTAAGNMYIRAGITWNTPTVLTHSSGTATCVGTGTVTIGNNSTQFYDVDISNFTIVASQTYNFTCNNLDIGGGVSGIFTTGTGTKKIDGTLNVGTGASFGTADTAYTLDLGGNLLTSTGTLIAPNAAGTFTFSGASWKTPTTFTHSSGTVTFDLAGTTSLGNDSTQFNAITVSNGTTLSCHASNYALTAAGDVTATGTLNGTGAAVSLKDLTISATTGVYTATSATTTITSKNASNDAWVNSNTFTHSNGKVDFTGTGSPYHIHGNNTWYDLEISVAAASTYLFENGKTQTIANSTVLTGTAGNILTLNSVSGAATWAYTIQAGKTQTHNYIDVSYSDASGGDQATQTNSTESSDNNVNWLFDTTTPTWEAAAPGNWSTAENWSDNNVPDPGDEVTFDATSVQPCTVDTATNALASLTITTGFTGNLVMNAVLTVAGAVSIDFGSPGTFTGSASLTMTTTAALSCDQTIPLLTINGSGQTITQGTAIVATALTITAGALNTSAASSFALTVSGATSVSGTLTCNASPISLGTGLVNTDAVTVAGTFTGGTGTAHTIGNITLTGAGAWTPTTGTTTVNGQSNSAGNCSFSNYAGTQTWNQGTISVTYAGTCGIYTTANITFGIVNSTATTFNISSSGSQTVTISGAYTLTSGTWTTAAGAGASNPAMTFSSTASITGTLTPGIRTYTFNGAPTINSGGTLGGNTAWTCDMNAAFGISSGGVFSAPNGSGTFNVSQTMICDGTYTANSGTYTSDASAYKQITSTSGAATITLYNLTDSTTGSGFLGIYTAVLNVQSAVTVNHNLLMQVATVLTVGTVSAAGSIVNGTGAAFTLGNNTAATCTVQAASATYPVVCTGDNWSWISTNYTATVKWLDVQFDATTGGGLGALIFAGNMTIDAFTVTAGDTLSCTVAGTTITGNASKVISVSGTFTVTGSAGSNVAYTGGVGVYVNAGTLNLSYFTATGASGVNGYVMYLVGACTYTLLDNLTLTSTGGGAYGGVVSAASNLPTFTNSTFDNKFTFSAGNIYSADIIILTGSNMQCSVCTFDKVSMQATSGWLESKDGSGNYTHYGILASSETPASGYRGSQCASAFTIQNADAYSTPFNSSYTLGAAMTSVTNLTVSASTTLDTSAASGYALSTSLACSVFGTLNSNGSACSFTGLSTSSGYGLQIYDGAAFNGGSGNHTISAVYTLGAGSLSLTSGTTTFNSGTVASNIAMYYDNTSTVTHNNGTVAFTRAGSQLLGDGTNRAKILYNVTVNNASCALSYYAGKSFALTASNNLTVTAGSLTTWDGTASANLTVTKTTSITGTLSCKASTVSLGSTKDTTGYIVVINSGGLLDGGTGTTHTIGNINVKTGGTYTATSGTTTFNGEEGVSSRTLYVQGGTINHSNGTMVFGPYAGAYVQIICHTVPISIYNLTIANGTPYPDGSVGLDGVNDQLLTVAGNLVINAGSDLNNEDETGAQIAVTGTTTINGTFTITLPTTVTFNGSVSVNSGGALGGATAYTANYNSTFTLNTGGTWTSGTGTSTFTGLGTFNADVVTTGGGATVNTTGSLSTKNWTVTAGDALAITNGYHKIADNCTLTIAGTYTVTNTTFDQTKYVGIDSAPTTQPTISVSAGGTFTVVGAIWFRNAVINNRNGKPLSRGAVYIGENCNTQDLVMDGYDLPYHNRYDTYAGKRPAGD